MDERPYRMTFGKYKRKPLSEVPPDYRSWLIDEEVYADKEDLKAALIEGKYLNLPAPTGLQTPPSTPSASRKRKVSDSETFFSPSRARKLAISKEAKRNDTMLNYDGAAYILDFGKHAGKKLNDVPSSYISWLIADELHKERADLAAALREEGFLADNRTPDAVDPTWIWLPVSMKQVRAASMSGVRGGFETEYRV